MLSTTKRLITAALIGFSPMPVLAGAVTVPTPATATERALTELGSTAPVVQWVQLREERRALRRAQRDLREERREYRRALRFGDRRAIRRERRDLRDARRDLRDARRDLRNERRGRRY